LQRNFFHTDFIKVRGVGNQFESEPADSMYKSDREMTICELQQRVVRAARTRDSAWRVLYKFDKKAALDIQPSALRPGLGAAYCRMLEALNIKTAAAAVVPQDTAKPPVAASVLPQDTAKPPVAAPAPIPLPHAAGVPPSMGVVPMGDSIPPTAMPVFVEGAKIQFGNAASIVDGHSVEIEKKFAIAVACFIFVLLGAPIALRFPRGGVGMTIGVSLAVFGLYYVGLIVGETMADRNYVSPFWGMWAANFILGVIGVALTVRLGREGTTNRGSETTELLDRVRRRVVRVMRRKL
jgi:lipopolysaccharide export system permease protein